MATWNSSTGNRLAVLGLGDLGLPLTVAFGQHRPTLRSDIDRFGNNVSE